MCCSLLHLLSVSFSYDLTHQLLSVDNNFFTWWLVLCVCVCVCVLIVVSMVITQSLVFDTEGVSIVHLFLCSSWSEKRHLS